MEKINQWKCDENLNTENQHVDVSINKVELEQNSKSGRADRNPAFEGGQNFPKVGIKETGACFFPQFEASVDLISFSNYLATLASFNAGPEECKRSKGNDPIKGLLCKYSRNDEGRGQPIKEGTSYV